MFYITFHSPYYLCALDTTLRILNTWKKPRLLIFMIFYLFFVLAGFSLHFSISELSCLNYILQRFWCWPFNQLSGHKTSLVFEWSKAVQSSNAIWILDHQLNTSHLNIKLVKVCYSDTCIQIPTAPQNENFKTKPLLVVWGWGLEGHSMSCYASDRRM